MLEGNGDPKTLTLNFTGNCWGENSWISFSSYKKNTSLTNPVTFYLNGQAIMNSIYKKDIGSLTVKANSVSTNWDDIVITATGTPVSNVGTSSGHSHPSCSTTLELTAYTISIGVQEKPWGDSWGSPEDKGTYLVGSSSTSGTSGPVSSSGNTGSVSRPWYHLWTVNDNAIRANVAPQCLGDIVTNSTFGGLDVEDFDPESHSPDTIAKPKWKKVISGVSAVFGSMATFSPKPGEQPLNQARVRVYLSTQPPSGMEATVHLAWFDPKNPKPYANTQHDPNKSWSSNPNGDGNQKKDNRQSLAFSHNTQKLTMTNAVWAKRAVVTFQEGLGDNFIVAVHPNNGVAAKYRFDTDGKTLLFYGSSRVVNTEMRTPILYVGAWNGFKVPKVWLFDEANYHIKTPEPTDMLNQQSTDASNSKSPVSILDFDRNFRMQVGFDYYGPTYVTPLVGTSPHSKHPHRSFHRNSGVYIYDLIEMQIFDTAALLAATPLETIILAPNGTHPTGIPTAAWQNATYPSNGIKRTGDTAYETISGCVTGIPYQAQSWHTKTQANLLGVSGRKSLDFNFTLNSNKTIATIVSEQETFNLEYGTGTGKLNNVERYKIPLAGNANWKLYLQSHWGSGVVFKNIMLQKLQ